MELVTVCFLFQSRSSAVPKSYNDCFHHLNYNILGKNIVQKFPEQKL